MVRRFRKFEAEAFERGARHTRQLIVAVTANGSELTDNVNNGFDEVCPKPLSVQNIYALVNTLFLENVWENKSYWQVVRSVASDLVNVESVWLVCFMFVRICEYLFARMKEGVIE